MATKKKTETAPKKDKEVKAEKITTALKVRMTIVRGAGKG